MYTLLFLFFEIDRIYCCFLFGPFCFKIHKVFLKMFRFFNFKYLLNNNTWSTIILKNSNKKPRWVLISHIYETLSQQIAVSNFPLVFFWRTEPNAINSNCFSNGTSCWWNIKSSKGTTKEVWEREIYCAGRNAQCSGQRSSVSRVQAWYFSNSVLHTEERWLWRW